MTVHARIRLTGRLRKSPAAAGLFYCFVNGANPDNLEASANFITAVVQDFREVTGDLY